jgi:LmbE family N-acetylglucosaminyl deacetylase
MPWNHGTEGKMTVLVIATHPDDEVLGCGGVIARHADQGHEVHVLVVTRGIPELFESEQIETTRQELRNAHKILGVSGVTFLDFPAPRLDMVPGNDLADAIAGVIRQLKPQIIYMPHRGDIHGDHQATYWATLVATRPINRNPVRRLLCYETLSETEWGAPTGDQVFVPTVFIDISSSLERKLEAMACYRSQLKQPPHPRSLRSIEALARLRGGTVSLDAAEAFMLVREIVSE